MVYEQYLSYAKQTLEQIRAEVGGDDESMTRAINTRMESDPEFQKACQLIGTHHLILEQA